MTETRKGWARRWGWIALIGLVTLLAAGWLVRKPIVRHAMAQWCAGHGLVCEAKFERLNFARVSLSDVSVRANGGQPIAAEEIDLSLDWTGFNPVISSVYVESPRIRGRLKEGRVDLYGVERLVPSGGGGGDGVVPAMNIADGRAILETEAGEATASFSMEGQLFDDATVDIVVDPVVLDADTGRVDLEQSHITVAARKGRLIGEATVSIRDVSIDGVSIRDTQLEGVIDTPVDSDAISRIRLSGEVGTAILGATKLEGAELDAQFQMHVLPELSVEAVVASLKEIALDVRGQSVAFEAYTAGAYSFEAHLTSPEAAMRGPVRLSVSNIVAPMGEIGEVSFVGEAEREAHGAVAVYGYDFQVKHAALTPLFRDLLSRAVRLPSPLDDHGAALGQTLARASADFSLKADFELESSSAGQSLLLHGPTTLSSASGMTINVEPRGDVPWLSARDTDQSASAAIQMQGGGAPTVSGLFAAQRTPDGRLTFGAQDLELRPWAVKRTAIEADIDELRLNREGTDTRIELSGDVGVEGALFGLELSETKLVGSFDANLSNGQWSGGPKGAGCPRLSTEGVVFGAIRAGRFMLDLCSTGDQSAKGSRRSGGALSLGDVRVPFESGSADGVLNLSDTQVSWSAGERSSVHLTAEGLDLPLALGDSTLNISGRQPVLSFASAPRATPSLSGELSETLFSGSLIPAKVSASAFAFTGTSPRGGVTGNLMARDVLIRDINEDPLYQPLLGQFSGRLTDGRVSGDGRLQLRATQSPIADVRFDLSLADVTGHVSAISPDLEFAPNGLRPTHLSERMRGLFTDATGRLSVQAGIDIEKGTLSGTGDVSLSDFSFQTTRLGRVDGVSADVHFTDLLGLTTAPDQRLTVASLNPGVLLSDGKMLFQFVEGDVFRVAEAAFPFAGGELALAPFDWGLGGGDQHIEVTTTLIQLRALIDTLALPDIEASGTVSGRFPIEVIGNQVFVRNARLKADDQGGHLAYTGQAGDAASVADSTTAMAFEALKDFDFTVLELGLDGNIADRMTISLLLAGKSRRGIPYGADGQTVKGQPFEFDIEINSPLSELFRSSQYYTSQNALTDIVVDRVQADRANKSE